MRGIMLTIVACAVGVTFSLVATSRGQSSVEPKADCLVLTVPSNSDYNLAFDPESGDLAVEYVDAQGNHASAIVDSRAASCKSNKGVAKAIAHAQQAANDVLAGECASLKAFANGAAPISKGGRVPSRSAAQSYITHHCH